jgi:hypothetical protein
MPLYSSLRAIVAPPSRSRGGSTAASPPADAGAARPVGPGALGDHENEQIRFPGEAEAAARIRRARGFRAAARDRAHDLALRSQRQHSLAHSTRLEAGQAPALFAALSDVCALLAFDEPIEIYQDAGSVNASMCAAEQGPLLTLEGPVLELLGPLELRGLLCHELAHYICHSGPRSPFRDEAMVALAWRAAAPTTPEEDRLLRLGCSLSVAQEITADRFELLATRDLGTYLTAALKLGTELSDAVLRHDPEVLLRQAREALSASVGAVDQSTSHPERHVRVRAAELFWESDLFHALTGKGPNARPLAEANAEIARLLTGWTPQGAASIDQARFEHFLLAAASAIASADGAFRKDERAFLARTLPSAFTGRLLPRAEADAVMDAFAAEVLAADDARARVTTLNFLCGLVDADGRSRDAELLAIDVVGRALGARQLFRHELRCRYGFDPTDFVPGQEDDAEDAVREATPALLRYLDTVVLAGTRRTTLRKLLRLGGYGRRTLAAIERLRVVLDASGVVAEPELRAARPDDALVLTAE